MAQGLGETWMILPCWPSRTVESRVQGWLDEGVAEGAVSGIGSRTLLGTKTGVVGVCKNSQRCDQTVQARDCRLHQQEHRLKSRKVRFYWSVGHPLSGSEAAGTGPEAQLAMEGPVPSDSVML